MDIEVLNILKTKTIPTEQLVYCPFDQNHKIRGKRITAHITKCVKNQTDKNFKVCPYHSLHYVASEYYSAHVFECPNKDESEDETLSKGEENATTEELIFESLKFIDTVVPKPRRKFELKNINPFIDKDPYKCGLLTYLCNNPIEFFDRLSEYNSPHMDPYQLTPMELQNMFVSQPNTPQMNHFMKTYFP